MAITRKPKAAATAPVDVNALISRGGSPGGQAPTNTSNSTSPVMLRIPTGMLQQINAAVKAQPIKTTRHRWILEALYEKLAREAKP
jgi:hypothetical protein